MDITEYFQLLLNLLVRQIPTLIVAGLGLWFAIARRRSLGRVSLWATWGFGLLVAYSLISVLLQYLITSVQISQVSGRARLESITWLSYFALAAHPIFIAALAALARAVFLDRNPDREVASPRESIGGPE